MFSFKVFYYTPSGTLVLCTAGGLPYSGNTNDKSSKPIEQLTPADIRTPLSKIRVRTRRVPSWRRRSTRDEALTRSMLKVFNEAGYDTLFSLLVATNADRDYLETVLSKLSKQNVCSSGISRIRNTILGLLENPGPEILSKDYEPRTYLNIYIDRVALPKDFPNVFNGSGIPKDVMAQLQIAAEEELGKVIGKLLITTARKVEEDRIALANKRLAKLATL